MMRFGSYPGPVRADNVIVTAPVTVPLEFLSIHGKQYPGGTGAASVAPTFPYGMLRIHDSRCGSWGALNPSNGVYDWSILDQYAAVGKPLTFVMSSCPNWAARVADQAQVGPYAPHSSGPPANIAHLSTFITALMTRYNSGPTKVIKYLEVWNEPNFFENYTGFFWGSAVNMVAIANAMNVAAKAVDPTVKILCPGFILTSAIPQFLNALDPVSGKRGWQCIDEGAFHPYYMDSTYAQLVNAGNPYATKLGDMRLYFEPLGLGSVGQHITEFGHGVTATDNAVLSFLAQPVEVRKTTMLRTLGVSAAAGIKSFSLYSYGSVLAGDLVNDTHGVIAACTEFSNALVGKTITAAIQEPSGLLRLSLSTGQSFVW